MLDNRSTIGKIIIAAHGGTDPHCTIEGTNLFAPENGQPPKRGSVLAVCNRRADASDLAVVTV